MTTSIPHRRPLSEGGGRSSSSSFFAGSGLTFWGQWAMAMMLVLLLLFELANRLTGQIGPPYRVLAVLTVLGSVPVYSLLRVYYKHQGYFGGLWRLAAGWLLLLGGLVVIGFVTKTSTLFSRELTLIWAVGGLALQIASYLPLHRFGRAYQRALRSERRCAVVGSDPFAISVADRLRRTGADPLLGLITGQDVALPAANSHRVLGNFSQIHELIARHDIRRLYLALPLKRADHIESLYLDLLDANVDVVWIPDLDSLLLLNHSVNHIDDLPAIYLNESPLTAYPTAALSKAALDRTVALAALLALSPLLLVIAILVKRSSPGPVIFKQKRHGWNGQLIEVWKFRSMRLHHDTNVKQATREDPRITPIGRFIRRTSIDELPQFFNVLQGRMSLVGPRPHAVAHNDYYTGKIDAYMARHRIKPGITGLAQVNGSRGETETIDKMQTRVELDLAYINNWSLWLDIKILIKTPFTLLGKDIY